MAVLVVFSHLQFSQTRDSQSCLKMCERLRTSSIRWSRRSSGFAPGSTML